VQCNLLGFFRITALFDKYVIRRLACAMIARCSFPRFRPPLQPVEGLVEIKLIKFNLVDFFHISTEIPGQVCGAWQAFFALRNWNRIWQSRRMAKAPAVKWTREHRLIALNLYCKLPFGKLHKNNPIIKEVAAKMGRTASSLAIKLCNFASLDPILQARGIVGMTGAANEDRTLWKEFQTDVVKLGVESEQLLHDLFTKNETEEVDFLQRDKVHLVAPTGPTETQATVKVRRGQQFFRQSVLTAYEVRCCISGINIPRLLVASHIKPWGKFPEERLNPRNGLCLSTLHDAAFDAGLITLDVKLKVVLSRRLRRFFPQPALEQNFVPFEGQPIRLPEKLAEPDTDFLRYHREIVFKDD
jgi:putative restriction endonuclease